MNAGRSFSEYTQKASSEVTSSSLDRDDFKHNRERSNSLQFVDVGINLSDPVYRGVYHGKAVHEDDLADVISRATQAGCKKLMITGSDLVESTKAIKIAKTYDGLCYATVGVHPCSAKQFDEFEGGPSALLSELKNLAMDSKHSGHVVAFGEIGLDYDRLFLTAKEQQLKYFEMQLDLAIELQLPLFLHMRAACDDFIRVLEPRLSSLPEKGLVHSFTGTLEEAQKILRLGLDIGINGCSLKTEDNLEVLRSLPLDRLQIETDGPWCEIRPSHASFKYLSGVSELPKAVKKEKWAKGLMVKGRNEPANIVHVAQVVANVKNSSEIEVCQIAWNRSIRMFKLGMK